MPLKIPFPCSDILQQHYVLQFLLGPILVEKHYFGGRCCEHHVREAANFVKHQVHVHMYCAKPFVQAKMIWKGQQ